MTWRSRRGWGGPWCLDRSTTPARWLRPLVPGGNVYVAGPWVPPLKAEQ